MKLPEAGRGVPARLADLHPGELVLLPGNGPKDRPLVRYRLSEVAAWSEEWAQRATVPQRRPIPQKAGERW